MRIIIIGGGIGGLSAYHALRKHLSESPSDSPVTIKVFESHASPVSTTSVIGGGLGLAPNGLRAISSISASAPSYIQEHGFGGAVMTFRNSTGTLLGRFWSGRKERYGFGHVLLPRAVVHEALLQDIPAGVVEWGKKVSVVREVTDGVEVEFEDGVVEKADLVIGADGVKSIVREAIFGKEYQAEYDGFTGVGGFIPVSSLPQQLKASLSEDPVTMTFGPQGFFGYSLASELSDDSPTTQIMWWSTYEATPPPRRDSPTADMQAQLLARHGFWKSPYDSPDFPVFKSIISMGCNSGSGADSRASSEKKLLILPRYFTERLPHWSSLSGSGKVILLGDAAHAMPPDSGQGVSCAAEDAVAIALLLKHYHSEHRYELAETLKRTAKGYEEVRMARVWHILDVAKRRGDTKKLKSWWQEWIRDWILWLLCKLPESINDRVFAHDVEAEVTRYIKTVESNPS